MNNSQFLSTIKEAFKKYRETGSRSNEKLKILHGAIASDIESRLNALSDNDTYNVFSLGLGDGKEVKIPGRYMEKSVDIVIAKNGNQVAGIAVKFVMSNYSQNSNNYFENMLGETANIRAGRIAYYQIIIIPEKMPYFRNNNQIDHIEELTAHNLEKYVQLGNDDIQVYAHTPNKTLLNVISFNNLPNNNAILKYYRDSETEPLISNSEKFTDYFSNQTNIIYNDYEEYIKKIVHLILGI